MHSGQNKERRWGRGLRNRGQRNKTQTQQLKNDKAKEKILARLGTSEAGVRPQHLSWELTVAIVVVDEPLLWTESGLHRSWEMIGCSMASHEDENTGYLLTKTLIMETHSDVSVLNAGIKWPRRWKLQDIANSDFSCDKAAIIGCVQQADWPLQEQRMIRGGKALCLDRSASVWMSC